MPAIPEVKVERPIVQVGTPVFVGAPLPGLSARDSVAVGASAQGSPLTANGGPVLPAPQGSVSTPLWQNQGTSLIAIIGAILMSQSKASSSFWSTFFNMGTASQSEMIQLAPMIASATISQYNADAATSQQQAYDQSSQGVVNVIMGGLMLFAAIKAPLKPEEEPKDPIKVDPLENLDDPQLRATNITASGDATKTAEQGLDSSLKSDDVNEQVAAKKLNATVDGSAEDGSLPKKTPSQNMKAALSGKGTAAKKTLTRFFDKLGKAQSTIQLIDTFGKGINNFIDAYYQGNIADAKKAQGQAQSVSQMLQAYQNWYNSNFQRSEDLRKGGSDTIDMVNQLLRSLADSVTQTVQSLYSHV